jgi:hypothetical protein
MKVGVDPKFDKTACPDMLTFSQIFRQKSHRQKIVKISAAFEKKCKSQGIASSPAFGLTYD